MGPYTSSGRAQHVVHDDDDGDSQYYEFDESDDQACCTVDKLNDETLNLSLKSNMHQAISREETSTRTVSLPTIPARMNNRPHRRSSNSTTQTHSRPTTASSGQTSSKGGSTAPTSTHSSRRNSKRHSTLGSQLSAFNAPSHETRGLLQRSVTTYPDSRQHYHVSQFPTLYPDPTIPQPPIRGVSYPGRLHEPTTTTSYSTPNLHLLPASHFTSHHRSTTSPLTTTTNKNNTTSPAPNHTYTNFHPASNIDWTLPSTRRKQYSKIDRATTGLRGVWTRYAPRWFGGGSRYGRFYKGCAHVDEDVEDGGSVRRFRLEVEAGHEGHGLVGKGMKIPNEGMKRRWRFSLGRGKGGREVL